MLQQGSRPKTKLGHSFRGMPPPSPRQHRLGCLTHHHNSITGEQMRLHQARTTPTARLQTFRPTSLRKQVGLFPDEHHKVQHRDQQQRFRHTAPHD